MADNENPQQTIVQPVIVQQVQQVVVTPPPVVVQNVQAPTMQPMSNPLPISGQQMTHNVQAPEAPTYVPNNQLKPGHAQTQAVEGVGIAAPPMALANMKVATVTGVTNPKTKQKDEGSKAEKAVDKTIDMVSFFSYDGDAGYFRRMYLGLLLYSVCQFAFANLVISGLRGDVSINDANDIIRQNEDFLFYGPALLIPFVLFLAGFIAAGAVLLSPVEKLHKHCGLITLVIILIMALVDGYVICYFFPEQMFMISINMIIYSLILSILAAIPGMILNYVLALVAAVLGAGISFVANMQVNGGEISSFAIVGAFLGPGWVFLLHAIGRKFKEEKRPALGAVAFSLMAPVFIVGAVAKAGRGNKQIVSGKRRSATGKMVNKGY